LWQKLIKLEFKRMIWNKDSMKQRVDLFEKIDRPLDKLMKRKREKSQIKKK
jgi:hypothetical protein